MKEKKEQSYVDVCGSYAAFLSLSEVGVGSFLHTFHIPFSGHFLSLNQIFLLSRASGLVGKSGSVLIPGSISFIAAALKSLSPSGKKLTPMLAIGMQGLLFNIGIFLFGHSAAGRVFGAAISSLWGFIQPLLIYYCIFGQALFHTFVKLEESFRSWIPMDIPSIWYVCVFVVITKVLISTTLALLAPKTPEHAMELYAKNLAKSNLVRSKIGKIHQSAATHVKPQLKNIAFLAIKDLCVLPFIACVLLSTVSFIWVEGAHASWLVLAMLRPIAIGFLFFFAIRMLPMEKVASWLERNHFTSLGQAFRIALTKVREF
jgi:hypothetical protein